jgi:hypothetical protein
MQMSMPPFLRSRWQRFQQWRVAPVTTSDRIGGAIVGGIAFLWIGVLGRLALGPNYVAFTELGYWALGSVIVGVILGIRFPKYVLVLLFPFTVMGFST